MAQVIDEDGDVLSEEELAAQKAEEEASRQSEAEAKRLADEEAARAEGAKFKDDRPTEKLHGELARIRDDRARLRAEKATQDAEIARLKEENVRWKARQELETEANQRLEDAKRRAGRPDPADDPVAAELWDMREWRRAKEAEDEQRRQLETEARERQRQQEERTQIFKQADDFLIQDVKSFRENNPDFDYPSAANFVSDAYLGLYTKSGYTPDEARAMLANNLYGLAAAAKERGQSAAKAVYETAVGLGWKPKAADTEDNTDKTVKPAPKPGAAAAKIAALKKGQSLTGLGGKTPSERRPQENVESMTSEEIANLSDDDFLRLKQDPKLGPVLDRRLEDL